MDFFTKILSGLKGLAIGAIVPIIEAEDPAIGQGLSDGAAAFSDGKLSLTEAEQLALDAIDIAAEKMPKYAAAFAALKNFITEDAPLIANKIIPDFVATVEAFKAAAAQ